MGPGGGRTLVCGTCEDEGGGAGEEMGGGAGAVRGPKVGRLPGEPDDVCSETERVVREGSPVDERE